MSRKLPVWKSLYSWLTGIRKGNSKLLTNWQSENIWSQTVRYFQTVRKLARLLMHPGDDDNVHHPSGDDAQWSFELPLFYHVFLTTRMKLTAFLLSWTMAVTKCLGRRAVNISMSPIYMISQSCSLCTQSSNWSIVYKSIADLYQNAIPLQASTRLMLPCHTLAKLIQDWYQHAIVV